jgi:cytoskeletal protein RodZ
MYENSIGDKLKNRRVDLKISIQEVSLQTKINKNYIIAIEENNFKIFDSPVYAKGFIKNYANFLDIDDKSLLAIYKRDFEENSIGRAKNINKKESNEVKLDKSRNSKIKITNRFSLTPKKIGLLVSLFIGVLLIYFISKIINNAFTPPYLKITSPVELIANKEQNLDFFQNTISIKGETAPNTTIKVNGIPIVLSEGGMFTTPSFPLSKGLNIINIVAIFIKDPVNTTPAGTMIVLTYMPACII